jgi:plasmid stabilization system protein ParE
VSLKVFLRHEAIADVEDAAAWYESQHPGLGGEFLTEVERSLELISDNPETFAVLYRGTRRVLVRRFPFGIHYRLIGSRIVVFAIVHASRDPEHWKGRAPMGD